MVGVKAVLVWGAVATAAIVCTPASAQQIYYEDGDYLYAVPTPPAAQDDVVTQTVAGPLVSYPAQGLITSSNTTPAPLVVAPAAAHAVGQRTPYYAAPHSAPLPAAYPAARIQYGAPRYLPGGARLVQFDPQAWLDECNARIARYDEHDGGRIAGAVLGSVAGGIVGNRIADGDRLAGTLAGAGVGALAGGLAGDAIDDRNDAGYFYDRDYCAAYLDDYMAQASAGAGSFSYTAGQQYMLVPVTVQVAQEAVYREYVAPPQ